jgi:hypothetical protein
MDAIEIFLRVIGAFYVFAGWVATRAALTSRLLDQALGAISCRKPNRIETAQTAWFLVQAHLVLASGLALMLLSDLALWLFLAAAGAQALYLVHLAPRHFDPVDPPEPKGRRQSTNAFVFYAGATAFVMWAWQRGTLLEAAQLPRAVWLAALVFFALHAAWAIRTAKRPLSQPASSWFDGDLPENATDPLERAAKARRIRLLADYQCAPLWALDDRLFGEVHPEDLGLSQALVRDLRAWAAEYTDSFSREPPVMSNWTDAQYEAHARASHPLARRLARERPDLTVYVGNGEGREFPITEVVEA